ncbi:MAG TPA: hypothetical protein VEC16_04155 [Alphaproteobacteria bacterium]|nr:hypothetical protein [Alphaproteobacteria bacterium]
MSLDKKIQLYYDKKIAKIEEKGGSKYDLAQKTINRSKYGIYGGVLSGFSIIDCILGAALSLENNGKQKYLDAKGNIEKMLENNSSILDVFFVSNNKNTKYFDLGASAFFTGIGMALIYYEFTDVDTTSLWQYSGNLLRSVSGFLGRLAESGYTNGLSDIAFGYSLAQNAKFRYIMNADSSRVNKKNAEKTIS